MPDANEPRIGLCLSGGGFRATLFHLGVTRYLYERGLLRNVTHITSVSGGSILAAHLVLHWERYNGSPSEFDAAVAELAGIFRHDLRGRVVCPWLFSCVTYPFTRLWCPRWWWRTRRLQAGYDLLYRGARMADLDQPGRPKLSILATSMTSGDMACFAGRKFLVVRNPDLDGSNGARIFPEVTPAGDVPVALAVAASSAFPPLFPPVVVGEETFGGADFPTPCHLADGGVFDNLGIRRLAWMARPDGGLELDMLVVSDAQRAFETEVQSEYNFLWTRAARSTDLMMNRLSFGEKRAAAHLAKERGWRLRDCELLRHVDSAKPYALSDHTQNQVKNFRTDLDALSDDEINAVARHGYAVARDVWETAEAPGDGDPAPPPGADADGGGWQPVGSGPPAPAYKLDGSDRLRWGLLRPTPWNLALLGALLLYAAVVAALFMVLGRQTVGGEDAFRRYQDYLHLTRILGDLALAEGENPAPGNAAGTGQPSPWDRLRQNWEATVDYHRANETWVSPSVRGDSNLIRQIDRAAAQGPSRWLRFETTALCKDLAGRLRHSPGYDAVRKVLYAKRPLTYYELLVLGDRVRDAESPEILRTTHRRFWQLYWQEVVFFAETDPQVEEAVNDFAFEFERWKRRGTGAPPEAVLRAITKLRTQIGAALTQSPDASSLSAPAS